MNKNFTPFQLREQIRSGNWTGPTSGAATGYIQANLVMLPKEAAFEFLLFCVRNPKPCPILDVLDPGQAEPTIAPGADLRTDVPKYRIFRHGNLENEVTDVRDLFDQDMVSFLLGCSFSFENALLAAGVSVRNIEEGKNVSIRRKIPPYGLFGGKPGNVGKNIIFRKDVQEQKGGKFSVSLNKGDRLRIETAGGGGYGSLESILSLKNKT